MKNSVVVIGLGEMGSVFARGLLKAGYPVFPVSRKDNIQDTIKSVAEPDLVVAAVAEKDIDALLQQVQQQWPAAWKDKLVLLQNELLPNDWQKHGIKDPTVISVWFEKKPGQDYKVLVPSPVHGPNAAIIQQALATLDIAVDVMKDEDNMLHELVRKNLYILTTNICGLETGGSVSELWNEHSITMNKVFDDVLEIQQLLTGKAFNRDKLLNGVLTAFDGDPQHQCMGRSAPQRLERAISIANTSGLELPELSRISQHVTHP